MVVMMGRIVAFAECGALADGRLQMPKPPEASGGPAGSVSGEKGQPEHTTADRLTDSAR